MTSLDDRAKGYENKYAHDEEVAFKINARRNKLLGLWAAGKLGKKGADAEAYAKEALLSDVESSGEDDIINKLFRDFTNAGIVISESEIVKEFERLLPEAREYVLHPSQ